MIALRQQGRESEENASKEAFTELKRLISSMLSGKYR